MEDEKFEHDQKVLQMTLDMEAVFRRKVEEKGEKMKRTEQDELEKIGNSRKELEEVKSSLERRREELLEEKRGWEKENNISLSNILLAGSTDSLGTKKKKHSFINIPNILFCACVKCRGYLLIKDILSLPAWLGKC